MTFNKKNIVKFFTALLWLVVGAGCITLLISAVRSKETKVCQGVEINITGVSNTFFIDKADVYNIIKNFGGDSTQKKSLASIDLGRIEKALEKDVWVKNAELYFDNNNFLKVLVEEREPIARLFTTNGSTFYIDSSCMMLPLSDKFSARLPVFTGFTSDAKILSQKDSFLLCSVKNISIKILADTFLMAMIDQIDIDVNRSFELVPKLGKQRIVFGDATDADTKFIKLKLFYKDVITQSGWNRYSVINLQYKNQVVATIRGKEDVAADSLRTLQLMKFIADDAARRSADSSQTFLPDTDRLGADSSLIQQSMEREDEGVSPAFSNVPVAETVPTTNTPMPVVKPAVPKATTAKMPVAKPVTNTVKPLAEKPVAKKLDNEY
ncbi:MAG: cell division protein FtsQ/DivIB [Ferruginibacter sp.]